MPARAGVAARAVRADARVRERPARARTLVAARALPALVAARTLVASGAARADARVRERPAPSRTLVAARALPALVAARTRVARRAARAEARVRERPAGAGTAVARPHSCRSCGPTGDCGSSRSCCRSRGARTPSSCRPACGSSRNFRRGAAPDGHDSWRSCCPCGVRERPAHARLLVAAGAVAGAVLRGARVTARAAGAGIACVCVFPVLAWRRVALGAVGLVGVLRGGLVARGAVDAARRDG